MKNNDNAEQLADVLAGMHAYKRGKCKQSMYCKHLVDTASMSQVQRVCQCVDCYARAQEG